MARKKLSKALARVDAAIAQGLARASIDDPVEAVRAAQWWPVFCPVEAA